MSTVSLAMIVRDEEHNLPACLRDVSRLFDEIVIVDTGSIDGTKSIAVYDRRGNSARFVDFPWCDDFSAARNEALRFTTQEWIFWLDADDRITDVRKLEALFAIAEPGYYFMFDIVSRPESVRQPRLFPRLPGIAWTGRVHENVLPSLSGLQEVNIDITIEHTGYLDHARNAQRHARNLRLLHLQLAESPNDPWTLYYLGVQHLWAGGVAAAKHYLDACQPGDDYLRERLKKLHGVLRGLP